jgi:Fic family protein
LAGGRAWAILDLAGAARYLAVSLVVAWSPMDIQPCLELIKEWVRRSEPLSVEKVCELHRKVVAGSMSAGEGGRIRSKLPGDAERLERELGAWVHEVNSELSRTFRLRDEFLASLADLHVRFHAISPFREGNGRTNRLLMFFFSLQHKRELLIVHDSYYRIIMNLCRQQGSSEYLFKYLKALGDETERRKLLAELEKLAF